MRKLSTIIMFSLLAIIAIVSLTACNMDYFKDIFDKESESSESSYNVGDIACCLNGFVFNEETKLPVGGAAVSAGNKTVITDNNGYFAIPGIAPGTYNIAVSKEGFLSDFSQTIVVDSGRFSAEFSSSESAHLAEVFYHTIEEDGEGSSTESRIGMTLDVNGKYEIVKNEDGGYDFIRIGESEEEEEEKEGIYAISTIGNSSTYGQAIVAVGLKSSEGTLTGSVAAKLSIDDNSGTFFGIPQGAGIVAYYIPTAMIEDFIVNGGMSDFGLLFSLIQDLESGVDGSVLAFRANVSSNGCFQFDGVPNGFYLLAMDPTDFFANGSYVHVGKTICFSEDVDPNSIYSPEDMIKLVFCEVVKGYGNAGNTYVYPSNGANVISKNIGRYATGYNRFPANGAVELGFDTTMDPSRFNAYFYIDDDNSVLYPLAATWSNNYTSVSLSPADGSYFPFGEKCNLKIYAKGANGMILSDISDDTFIIEASDEFSMQVVSVRSVDRSELPIGEYSRGVSMEAGSGLAVEFNKEIDTSAEGTFFKFTSDIAKVTGDTKYVIKNENGKGVVYVWNDSIHFATDDLELSFCVCSNIENDYCMDVISVDYSYALELVDTNLYGVDYYGNLVDEVFQPGKDIELFFDKVIPSGAWFDGVLTCEGEYIPFSTSIDANKVTVDADFEYGKEYTLKFKLVSSDCVILYSTVNGLDYLDGFDAVLYNDDEIVFNSLPGINLTHTNFGFSYYEGLEPSSALRLYFDEEIEDVVGYAFVTLKSTNESKYFSLSSYDNYIELKGVDPLAAHETYYLEIYANIETAEGVKYLSTNQDHFIDYAKANNVVSIEDDKIVFRTGDLAFAAVPKSKGETNVELLGTTYDFNPYDPMIIQFNYPVTNAVATLVCTTIDGEEIPAVCEFEGNVVTVSLGDKALFPEFTYYLKVTAYAADGSSELTTTAWTFIEVMDNPEFINNQNGLSSFSAQTGDFDSKTTSATFEWTSSTTHYGADCYRLYKRDAAGVWTLLKSFNEKTKIDLEYDTSFSFTVDNAFATDELAFNGYCDFMLITYDDYGLMVQSRFINAKDNKTPSLVFVGGSPSIPKNEAISSGTKYTFKMKASTSEYLKKSSLSVSKYDVPDGIEVDYEMDSYNSFVVTIEFVSDFSSLNGRKIGLRFNYADTSGNSGSSVYYF